MLSRLAKAAGAVAICVAVAGCNTANTPLASDEETATLGPARCPSGTIGGSGSAAQRTAYEEVTATYGERCESRSSVTYDSADADAALAAFSTAKHAWIGVDAPLDETSGATAAARCSPHPVRILPVVANPIALAYHLPGVDRLVLSGPVSGRILDGGIATWDHPEIAALNPGVRLPAERIVVVGRADASASTEQLSAYLAEAGGWPRDRVGRQWAGAGERKSGTFGVVQAIRATPHSIGYAEFSAARDNSLPVAWLDNGAGPVEVSARSAARGLTEATVADTDGDLRITPRYAGSGPGSYPLVSVGYAVFCTSGLAKGEAPVLKDFLGFLVSEQQQQSLGELGLAPLPAEVRDHVAGVVTQIS